MNRSEVLLALILLAVSWGASKQTQVHYLSLAGFTNVEIANILEMYALDVTRLANKPWKKGRRR